MVFIVYLIMHIILFQNGFKLIIIWVCYIILQKNSVCAFYSGWVVLSFGILVASVRTNCLYICQCLTAFAFFLLRAIGEGCGSLGTKRNAAGILQAISGFFSLLVCFSQILNNETFYRLLFPTCPTTPVNDIDMPTVPVVSQPVVAQAVPVV